MSEITAPLFGLALIAGGWAISYVQPQQVLRPRTAIPVLYFTSCVAFLTYAYLGSWISLVGTNTLGYVVVVTILNIVAAISAMCLEACYILRLSACLKMYSYAGGPTSSSSSPWSTS